MHACARDAASAALSRAAAPRRRRTRRAALAARAAAPQRRPENVSGEFFVDNRCAFCSSVCAQSHETLTMPWTRAAARAPRAAASTATRAAGSRPPTSRA
jgi:hypothetical protein